MPSTDKIKTVNESNEFRFKEKGSLFIGQVFPVEKKDEFYEKYHKIKQEYYEATHHCYAYQFLSGEFKYSDDGEPNGTAGIRIHNAIKHFDLTNIGLIVIRYFGGTKLGVGPLGKAYYSAAEGAINSAKIVTKQKYKVLKLKFGFEHLSSVYHILAIHQAVINAEEYNECPIFTCFIQPNSVDNIRTALMDKCKGQIDVIEKNKIVWQLIENK